jgi:cytochrome b pre-mRNA-processing protein 3
MLNRLFRGLTAPPTNGERLFAAITAEARQPHWYLEGEVPDTIDGRFSVLATVAALVMVRLEQLGDAGNSLSVVLTERFVEVMESEHRELGLGDPSLGKTVRKLVGSLARRTGLWRSVTDWRGTARQSVYKAEPSATALDHVSAALQALWAMLERSDAETLANGRIK